jgi:hypothetical protein
MKRLIMIGLTLLMGGAGASAGEAATSTNPALFYWQAFTLLPQLSNSQYSSDVDYNLEPLNKTYDALVGLFDNTFRVVRKAAESKAECNWGIDLSDGPYAFLPHLAKAKWIAQINATLRGPYFLRKGKHGSVASETLAVFKLGRDTARDGTLLSILVQGAIENINVKFIADHFGMFDDADIQRMADGIKMLPKHLTVKDALPVERATFLDWYKSKVKSFIDHPGEKGALAQARQLLLETIEVGAEQNHSGISDEIIREAGGTPEGLIAYLDGLAKWYDEAGAILALPDRDLVGKLDEFSSRIEKEGSIISREVLPAFGKAQRKEFWTQTRMAILDAAIAYRLHGKTGFDAVAEPVAEGNFQLVPTETGFEIRSKLNSEYGPEKERGKPVTLSFISKK